MRDLLILLFVAAIIMAVFVQWIIPAREDARRAVCHGRLRGIGHALNSCEASFRAYPAAAMSCTADAWRSTGIENGQTCVGPNWAIQILGQMEEIQLARLFAVKLQDGNFRHMTEFRKTEIAAAVPDFMLCPSSELASALHDSQTTQLDNLSKGNYAACMGTSTYLHSIEGNKKVDERLVKDLGAGDGPGRQRGVLIIRMRHGWETIDFTSQSLSISPGGWLIGHGKGVKRSEITDGTSHTVLVSEVLPFDTDKPTSEDIRGVWAAASMGASTYSHATTPNSTTPDRVNGCDAAATGRMKCIEIPPGTPEEGDTFAAARSSHQGGVNVVFSDGSSRFYTDQVDQKIWKALATRSGGETHVPADIGGPGR